MTDALAAGIDALHIDLGRTAQDTLHAYVGLLEKWNRTHNLTAVRDPALMITHHLLDSLAVLPHLPQRIDVRMADVGSGGGLPGIPLAVARPEWRVTLVDSNRKKVAFLRQAAIELGLSNLEVTCVRVEDFVPPAAFDVIIARAYAALAVFVAHTRHLLARGGQLVAMKGLLPRAEIAELPTDIRVVAAPQLEVPNVAGTRHLVIMEAAA
jgi:16S rRNA (guanine527-N7)-methyltransferase